MRGAAADDLKAFSIHSQSWHTFVTRLMALAFEHSIELVTEESGAWIASLARLPMRPSAGFETPLQMLHSTGARHSQCLRNAPLSLSTQEQRRPIHPYTPATHSLQCWMIERIHFLRFST